GGPAALKYLPLFGTLLLFLVTSDWLSVVPLVGQVTWLHSPTADYHTNFGLAIVAFVLYQAEGFRTHRLGYVKRWINLSGFAEPGGIVTKIGLGFIFVLVGVIELFSELFRMITLTLRLWGNVLGGEIMLVVMSALLFVPGLALPFVGLEVGIGIGILTGLSSEAMGRNPDAAAAIRTNMIIGAALAEGLGILAFVLGILLSGKTV